ncbi:MAG: 7-cyano-7-deazaguanine synthase QueC [Magnetococcales bacterium]|nr:7-cyano-7-deazaguanine synthase QueC [Magnetococcales bacterium]
MPKWADKKAVVLVSGGLDSATCLHIAQADGFEIHTLSFRYGQRHLGEIAAASRLAQRIGATSHLILDLNPELLAGSALTGGPGVPKEGLSEGIPVTYVPARNTVFLSMALARAEILGAYDLFIGVNAVDYSGYPDCRPAFIEAFEKLANLATREGISGRPFRIHAPLIQLTKAQIIERGLALGVDYGLTRSCYDPDVGGAACGLCDSCRLRLAAFHTLGIPDPAPYRTLPDAG